MLNKNMAEMENVHPLNVKDLFYQKKVNLTTDKPHVDEVIEGLLDWDKTHLNGVGYHILTKKSILSLSINLYEKRAI